MLLEWWTRGAIKEESAGCSIQPVWGISIRNLTSLGSDLASVTDLKEFKLHTVYAVISEAIKPLQLVGQAAEFKFESKFEPLQVIWQSLRRLFQKVIEGLEGNINGQALGAALRLCLRGISEHKHRASRYI